MDIKQIKKYLEQYEQAYKEYLKTLETEELKNWVESKSNYTMNSSDDREILIDDIIYDETLKLQYAIRDYKLTEDQIKNQIEDIKQQVNC